MSERNRRRALRGLLLLMLLPWLAACLEQSVVVRRAPGQDAPAAGSANLPGDRSYRVVAGDTLYKISMQYGLDYRDIAAWNGIAAPYTIYPGQTLRLAPGSGAVVAAPPPAPSAPAEQEVEVIEPPAGSEQVGGSLIAGEVEPVPSAPPAPPVSTPQTVPSEAAAPGSSEVTGVVDGSPVAADSGAFEEPEPVVAAPPAAADSSPTTPVTAPSVPVAATPSAPSSGAPPAGAPLSSTTPPPTTAPAAADVQPGRVSASGWAWPASGRVVATYASGDPTRQGIDIAGEEGSAVRAARDGEVVYSGSGLIGYGELVIIKHSPELLSAYGHNRKRLVKEGQKVKAGEKIAEMGRNASNRVILHFEIRRNGKPIDPLPLLPPR